MEDKQNAPARLSMAIATLQGLCLLGLYRTIEHDVWPSDQPVFGVPLWLVVLVFPVLLLLSLRDGNYRSVTWMSGAVTALFALLGAYIGWQLMPVDQFSGDSVVFAFIFTMIIVTFKTAMYLQVFANGEALQYTALFTNSWRNFLVMALSMLFLLAVALLLLLWAQLFKVIGVDFFEYLFQRDWFLFPVLGFSFGVGIVIFRGLTEVIDNITSLLLGLIRLLLPIVVLLSILFLISLLLVGTETLWDTGRGSVLVLWLTAVILFFINAVYQDGRGDPAYSSGIHRFVSLGVMTLPLLSALSLYGLMLRVLQYGLTVERIYGLLVWLVLALFSLGYAWGVVSRRDNWTQTLAQVNVRMGLVLAALLLLFSSPVLDPRKMALNSQLARVERGETSIEDFDMQYVRRHLARPGHEAYERLAEQYGPTQPTLVKRWGRLQYWYEQREAPVDIWEKITLRPADLQVPEDLRRFIQDTNRHYLQDSVLLAVDMNNDDALEYLLLGLNEDHLGAARFYYFEAGQWKQGRLEVRGLTSWQEGSDRLAFEGPVKTEPPKFLNVRIGNALFMPREDDFFCAYPLPRPVGASPATEPPSH